MNNKRPFCAYLLISSPSPKFINSTLLLFPPSSHSFGPLLILLVKIPHDHVTVIHSRLEDGKLKTGGGDAGRISSTLPPFPEQGRGKIISLW